MKNVFKVLGIIAIVAVIGFSFAACGGDDGGDDGGDKTNGQQTSGQQYKITITGFTGKNGQDAYVEFWVNATNGLAWGKEKISNNSVTILLYNSSGNPWTTVTPLGYPLIFKLGTGDNIQKVKDIKSMYVYTEGKTFEELNISSSTNANQLAFNIPKYHFPTTAPTVNLDQFKEIPTSWNWSWN